MASTTFIFVSICKYFVIKLVVILGIKILCTTLSFRIFNSSFSVFQKNFVNLFFNSTCVSLSNSFFLKFFQQELRWRLYLQSHPPFLSL